MTRTMRTQRDRAGRARHLSLLLLLFLLPGCAGRARSAADGQQLVVQPASEASVLASMAPSFLLQGTQATYNRIGRVEASKQQGRESVGINSAVPMIYAGSWSFVTAKGSYTNLIYRVHFPETPFSLVPFYLGAGKNVGVLVILTLDAQRQPLLVTTVNTCGCYAVSIPTELLPPSLYPDHWPTAHLPVFGERLPVRLKLVQAHETILVVVRADVHRVMDIQVVPRGRLPAAPVQEAEVTGLEALKALPLGDGTVTSLYYDHWPLTGHVKGAIKPWESLTLSLVSLDFFIGMDKEYPGVRGEGTRFYTSLKPWNRNASDLNDFAAYLHFNGWKL